MGKAGPSALSAGPVRNVVLERRSRDAATLPRKARLQDAAAPRFAGTGNGHRQRAPEQRRSHEPLDGCPREQERVEKNLKREQRNERNASNISAFFCFLFFKRSLSLNRVLRFQFPSFDCREGTSPASSIVHGARMMPVAAAAVEWRAMGCLGSGRDAHDASSREPSPAVAVRVVAGRGGRHHALHAISLCARRRCPDVCLRRAA